MSGKPKPNNPRRPPGVGVGGGSSKSASFSSWRTQRSSDAAARRLERFATTPANSNPTESDNLDDFGFVSKGDDRLKKFENQERYHKHITGKYLAYCAAAATTPDDLELDFAALSVTPLHCPLLPPASKNSTYADTRNAELTSILLSQRKLREGIVASRRADAFAADVFKAHIRAAILVQQIESYHSALLHLLYTLHHLLDHHDVQEFASYHMLHLAARMEDYGAALAVRHEFRIGPGRATQALGAMLTGNYWSFRAARMRVDQYLGSLMDFAEERMTERMLKCVGAAYFTVGLEWLERISGLKWLELQKVHGVGWELEAVTKVITVRRPKGRARPEVKELAPAGGESAG